MEFSIWGNKINKFIYKPPLLIAQALIDRIPGHPFQIAKLFILELPEAPAKNMRGFGGVREAEPKDIPGMCLLENNKEKLFRKRFAAGDRCVVAVDGEQIVGYQWFSAAPLHVEERFNYKFEIPNDTIYSFDALIKPEYRLRGIWMLLQKFILKAGLCMGRKKIRVFVDYGNNSSLNTHLRFGYTIVSQVLVVRGFRKILSREKKINLEYFNPKRAPV
jgi:GNAT superfamily N-acetyltransferase